MSDEYNDLIVEDNTGKNSKDWLSKALKLLKNLENEQKIQVLEKRVEKFRAKNHVAA